MDKDYKSTILLPKTNFSMRAGLPNYEPKVLERWEQQKLYDKIRQKSKHREKFILHDGPPYANGHIHIGTALNKILKDIVSRSQQMMGKNSHYIPGWDCHGLPIEWQVEQQYRKSGKDKDVIPINDFRKECREFAEKWIFIQKTEFQRLGVTGDWDNRYVTMDYSSEAKIAGEIFKFLMNGGLYRGSKPVMWSVVEKTALAEAEVEYHDQNTETLIARFPILKSSKKFHDMTILIWTTTPWTLPANRAIAYNEKIEYSIVRVDKKEEDSQAIIGERVIVATDALERLKDESGVFNLSIIDKFL
ncbi:MAG: Isoleucine--tRNA ligase, partial [Alphaproteobacteria bacterium MarineAlpha2_Bin1]